MWRAYVDESESNQRLDPHTYLLAAALIDDEHTAEARAEVRGLLRPGQCKLHWREESAESRARITKAVAALPALHVIVVRTGVPGERSERRRRKCLERLVYELAARRELAHLTWMVRSRAVHPGMQLDHVPGPGEPLLWIPDTIAAR